MATDGVTPPSHGRIGFFSDPAIDGDTVVFLCDGAVWEVAATGGGATRRTARFPKISKPIIDTKRDLLAFAASHQGPPQIYVQTGRERDARRITYFPESCLTVGWYPDGRVIFISSRGSVFRQAFSGWLVDTDGVGVERLSAGPLSHFAKTARGVSVLSPPGVNPQSWRCYRGGARGEIFIDVTGSGHFRRLAQWAGNLSTPMLCGDRVYFLLDQDGAINLFSCDESGQDLRKHTHHEEFAVRSAATDGRRLVYCAGADVFLLDPTTEATRLDIELNETPQGYRPRAVVVGRGLCDADGSPGGELLACCAFGALFEYSLESNEPGEISVPGRCTHARYLADGTLVAVLAGEDRDQLIVVTTGRKRVKRIKTKIKIGRVLTLVVSASGFMAVLTNHRHQVLSVNLASGATTILDTSTYLPVEQIDVSPDGSLCVYALPVGHHRTILRVVFIEGRELVAETDPPLADFSPKFLADDTIVFLSLVARLGSGHAMFTSVNALTLRPDLDRTADESWAEQHACSIRRLPVPEVWFTELIVLGGDVVLVEPPDPKSTGQRPLSNSFSLVSEMDASVGFWRCACEQLHQLGNERFMLRVGSDWQVGELRTDPRRIEPYKMDLDKLRVEVDRQKLYRASIHQAWRIAADQVPGQALEAAGWSTVGHRYQALAERACHARDLADILAEMLGHLRMSHAFAVRPAASPSNRQGLLGVDVAFDQNTGAWRITSVPLVDGRTSLALGLAAPELGARVGDILETVDGESLSERSGPDLQLVDKAGQQVNCVLIGHDGQSRTVVFEALSDDRPLRYAAWVLERRRFVSSRTRGRIGYLHLPDVSARMMAGVARWLQCRETLAGIVLDVRYNEGGAFGAELAQLLARRPLALVHTRWSPEGALPVGASERPIVVLTNRFTSSGGELLAEALRQLVASRIIGETTFGGGVGNTNSRRLPDGSDLFLPEIQIARPREWADIENRGVIPDIQVAWNKESQSPDPLLLRGLRELSSVWDKPQH